MMGESPALAWSEFSSDLDASTIAAETRFDMANVLDRFHTTDSDVVAAIVAVGAVDDHRAGGEGVLFAEGVSHDQRRVMLAVAMVQEKPEQSRLRALAKLFDVSMEAIDTQPADDKAAW